MDTAPFPPVPRELLERLEKQFPDTIPVRDLTPQELGRLQGEQTVIRLLRSRFDAQNKTVLENP